MLRISATALQRCALCYAGSVLDLCLLRQTENISEPVGFLLLSSAFLGRGAGAGHYCVEWCGVERFWRFFERLVPPFPKDIKGLLGKVNMSVDNIDYYIFHQSNNFMNNYIAKKLKLDKSKIPSTIQKYGNTSSVSVPLTIVSELKNELKGKHLLMLSAFGVGLSWGTALVPFVDCRISDIVEI